ncbi:hypothetical protein [Allomuricauda sp. d1]|uniref:hypothetical protein n=1 Tax=Allomuricauda sp. d1 TaxID=3136725 RepID=UPI0031E0CC0D
MKISAMDMVGLTTLVLVVVTVLASINFSFGWVFYLTVFGQIMVGVMVYKVLTDNYKTSKTFEDFYEDKSYKQDD